MHHFAILHLAYNKSEGQFTNQIIIYLLFLDKVLLLRLQGLLNADDIPRVLILHDDFSLFFLCFLGGNFEVLLFLHEFGFRFEGQIARRRRIGRLDISLVFLIVAFALEHLLVNDVLLLNEQRCTLLVDPLPRVAKSCGLRGDFALLVRLFGFEAQHCFLIRLAALAILVCLHLDFITRGIGCWRFLLDAELLELVFEVHVDLLGPFAASQLLVLLLLVAAALFLFDGV